MADTAPTALVTGTSRGIGPAIATALHAHGFRLLCHARTAEAAARSAAAVGGEAIHGDLETQGGVEAIAQQVVAVAPTLDVLVHNAGVMDRNRLEDVERGSFEHVLAVNVLAPVFLTQALLGPLRAGDGARVVVVSSTMGQLSHGMSGRSLAYRVSKAAVNAMVANTAVELRHDGILVNAMHPGWVRTDMGGPSASVAPEQAAETALMLAKLPPDGPTGGFFLDGEPILW